MSGMTDDIGNIGVIADGDWFVITTLPQSELTAVAGLRARGYGAYSPQVIKKRRTGHRDRDGRQIFREAVGAMFPGYGFVRFVGERAYGAVCAVPGVRDFLKFKDRDQDDGIPCVLPTALVREIHRREMIEMDRYREASAARRRGKAPFLVGQELRVIDGPFSSFFGKVARLDDHGRVEMLVSLFGRKTRVSLDAEQVQAVA